MTGSRTLTLLCLLPIAVGAAERPPIRDGEHAFRHRSAEHPNLPAHPLVARVSGTHIVLINHKPSSVFPLGVVAEGELMWHAASKQLVQDHRDIDRTTEKRPQIADRERGGLSLIEEYGG